MKTYIIYNSASEKSSKISEESLKSFSKFDGWKPELYDGCVPELLESYDIKYNLPEEKIKKFNDTPMYPHKKSCFYSHYSLWIKCIDSNEDIAIVEHDTECIGNFPAEYSYDGITQLTAGSMLGRNNPFSAVDFRNKYNEKGGGLHEIWFKHPHGHYGLAGCTGYIMTPKSAKVYKEICENDGWFQNDLLITSDRTPLYYVNPSPIKWCREKELRSSSKGIY